MFHLFEAPQCSSESEVDNWFTPARFTLILLVLILAMFPDVVLGARTFIFRDFGMFGYPLAFHYRESFWRGEVPLWNPFNHCGMPFLAQWNTLVLYPGSLFYLLLPLDWALGAFNLAHLFLCGIGMYTLAWNWTGNRFAGAVAGLGFAFNGFTLNCLMWPNYIASLAWMPLVVLTVERASRLGGGRRIAAAALTGAMQMLSGTPEVILLTWLLICALCILQLFSRPSGYGIIVRVSIIVLLVAGLAAAQLLPFLDLMRNAQRASGVASKEWAMPLTGWANFVLPLFRTQRTPTGVYFQEQQDITSSYYLGIIMLALALIGIVQVPDKRVRLLAAFSGICLVLAFGPAAGVYTTLLKLFPPLGLVRFPVKFVMLPVFAAPLMAAFAVATYLKSPEKARFWHASLSVGIAFVLIIGLLIGFSLYRPASDEVSSVTAVNGLTRAGFLIAGLALWFAVGRVLAVRLKWLCALGLLSMLWVDVITHMPWQNPTVEPGIFQPRLAPLQELNPKPTLGDSRAMLSLEAILALRTRMPTNAATGYLLYRLALYNNLNLLDEIPKLDGFFALRLGEQEDVRSLLYPTSDTYRASLADFLSVSQVTSKTNIFSWTARSTYLPMVTAGQAPMFLGPTETLDALASADFNPRTTVFLRSEDKPLVSVSRQSDARILRQKWSAHQIAMDIETTEPALVVCGQAFYHNWKAYVDDKPTPLLHANYAFQALEVPSGSHHLKLVYEDRAFRWGCAISAASLMALLVAWRRGVRHSLPAGGAHQA